MRSGIAAVALLAPLALALLLLLLGDGGAREQAAIEEKHTGAASAAPLVDPAVVCVAPLQPIENFNCGYGSKADCSEEASPVDPADLCPANKLQDAYHVEPDGTCTQVCLSPGLKGVAYNHGVRYGLKCYAQTPLNQCSRFYLKGTRAGIVYYTFFCMQPCSAKEQTCNGTTSEYTPSENPYVSHANRGPSRPRWAGDWWEGVPEDALEKDAADCAALQPAAAPAQAVATLVQAAALTAGGAHHTATQGRSREDKPSPAPPPPPPSSPPSQHELGHLRTRTPHADVSSEAQPRHTRTPRVE
ncbi:hypothetical protein T492DRAFT_876932 [Pavlovales sp. CCMP2436]|nr:hypothetical protein T492DRAFT_876932 [Pavlovales sp. CCMP2436]